MVKRLHVSGGTAPFNSAYTRTRENRNIPSKRRTTEVISDFLKSTTKILILVPPLIGAGVGVWYTISPNNPETQKRENAQTRTDDRSSAASEYEKSGALATERDVVRRNQLLGSCVKPRPVFTKVMPLSLKNAIGVNSFPYWLRLEVGNECSEPISLTMDWQVRPIQPKPIVRFRNETDEPFKVEPGKTEARNYDLNLETFSDDFSNASKLDLKIKWHVLNERQVLISDAEAEITLLPPDVYKWDLVKPTGERADPGFVLASLTNWVITASSDRDTIFDKIKSFVGKKTRAENWIQHAYEELFSGPQAIDVVEGGDEFPPDEPRRIRTPQEVLRTFQGDPLEISLMIASVIYGAADRGNKFALFILPGDRHLRKRFLLGWEADFNKWMAIDAALVNSKSFVDNVEQASKRLGEVMVRVPSLAGVLRKDGVYVNDEGGVFALEFHAVHLDPDYRIRGLPVATASGLAMNTQE